jgi:hypothetical protein
MSCRVFKDDNGNVTKINASNGERSSLYDALSIISKDPYDHYAKTNTSSFKEANGDWVTNPELFEGHLDSNNEPMLIDEYLAMTDYNVDENTFTLLGEDNNKISFVDFNTEGDVTTLNYRVRSKHDNDHINKATIVKFINSVKPDTPLVPTNEKTTDILNNLVAMGYLDKSGNVFRAPLTGDNSIDDTSHRFSYQMRSEAAKMADRAVNTIVNSFTI